MRVIIVLVALWGGAVSADPVAAVMDAARTGFAGMPTLEVVPQIAGVCGADTRVNQQVAYCTSVNRVYLAESAAQQPKAPYLVAHVLGHAVQVQHGVADVALAMIRARRSEEAQLRGYVAAQVDCIAGFLFQEAGLPQADLSDWFRAEPFAGTHWGRDPLRVGPKVQIGLAARDAWFQRGQAAADLGACAAGEFGADLLLDAYRG